MPVPDFSRGTRFFFLAVHEIPPKWHSNFQSGGIIRINLGGSETDQSVDVPDTCVCEETCYRIAYI